MDTPNPRPPGRKTPLRNIGIPDETWHAAQRRADAEGTTVSAVIRRYLTRWAKEA